MKEFKNSFEVVGVVKEIFEPMTFASGFTKREFLIETGGSYPTMVKFSTLKEKISLLDDIYKGYIVSVFFSIKGSEYKGKYYNDLVAFSIKTEEAIIEAGGYASNDNEDVQDGDEDMPFQWR